MGFSAGLLQSYSDRLHEHNLLDLQDEVGRRKAMADQLTKLIADQSIRPEAREEYQRQLHTLHTTPYHQKLPKGIGQFAIDIKPKEGQSLTPITGPIQQISPKETQIPGEEAIAPIQPPNPPTSVSPQFSPAELGQRAADFSRPEEEQKVKIPMEARIAEARRYAAEAGIPFSQAYLILSGKGGMIAPKSTTVILKDGSQVKATKQGMPGDIIRYYNDNKEDITENVIREYAGISPGDKVVRGLGGAPAGVTIDGKTWYGEEDNIPERAKIALEAIQKALPPAKVTTTEIPIKTDKGTEMVPRTSRTGYAPVRTSPPASKSTTRTGEPITSGPTSLRVFTPPITSTTRTMMEAAPKVIDLANRVEQLVDQQVKKLGPASSRWNEFWAGKVGAPNAEFTKLRADAMLLQTMLMRMHTGARGGVAMMDHFKQIIDAGKQSPANMKAAAGEIRRYAENVKKNPNESSEVSQVKVISSSDVEAYAREKGIPLSRAQQLWQGWGYTIR